MSIMEYFSKPAMGHSSDSLFGPYNEMLALRKQLPELRQKQLLECCAASMGKGNEVKLTVVDQELFNKLAHDIGLKEARLNKILAVFQAVDSLVAEVQAKGVKLKAPTAYGVKLARIDSENRIYSRALSTRNNAIDALSRGASLAEVSMEADPSLQETADYMKSVDARCVEAIKDL